MNVSSLQQKREAFSVVESKDAEEALIAVGGRGEPKMSRCLDGSAARYTAARVDGPLVTPRHPS